MYKFLQNGVMIATMKCIEEKNLTPTARKEIVQTSVKLLITEAESNVVRGECEIVTHHLILKNIPLAMSFMKDDIGTGYVSYTRK